MPLFRNKPVAIEATQWFKNGDHPLDGDERFPEGSEFAGEKYAGKIVGYYRSPKMDGQTACKQCGHIMHVHGWIDTPEGGHVVCPGDWIVTTVKGEYPCKPDIFAATYDAVVPDPDDR